MQVLKTLMFTKSAAGAAIAVAAMTAPVISHASPDAGMVCRNGYTAQFANGNLKCKKVIVRVLPDSFECRDSRFPNKVVRIGGVSDLGGGRDLCTAPGIVITSDSSLRDFAERTHYVFATVNRLEVIAARERAERAEELILGLGADGVDSESTSTVVVNDNSFGQDKVHARITLYTFPVPAPSITLNANLLDARTLNLPPNSGF